MDVRINAEIDRLHGAIAHNEVRPSGVRAAEASPAFDTRLVTPWRVVLVSPTQIVPIVSLIEAAVVGTITARSVLIRVQILLACPIGARLSIADVGGASSRKRNQ